MLIAFTGTNNAIKTTMINALKEKKDPKIYSFYENSISTSNATLSQELSSNKIIIWNQNIDELHINTRAKNDFTLLINSYFKEAIRNIGKTNLTFFFENYPQDDAAKTRNSTNSDLKKAFLKVSHNFYKNKAKLDKPILVVADSLSSDDLYNQVDSTLKKYEKGLVIIDHKRANALVSLVRDEFLNDPFFIQVQKNLIENQIPKSIVRGSLEHARFLFFIASNDHGLKSNSMYDKVKALYQVHPEYFDAKYISKQSAAFVKEQIADKISTRYPNAFSKNWVENARKIVREFDGEPLNIFKSTTDALELLQIVKSFSGYGPKIGGMVVRAAYSLKFNDKLKDMQNVPVPVDVHDSQILFQSGILYTANPKNIQHPRYIKTAQQEILDACNRQHLDWTIVDKALWLIGSTGTYSKFIGSKLSV